MIPIKPDYAEANRYFTLYETGILDRIGYIKKNGHIKKSKKQWDVSPKMQKFIRLSESTILLEKLLTCPPEQLKDYLVKTKKRWPEIFDKTQADYQIIRSIFYDYGYKKIKKFDFIRHIALQTCAYCNRNYIYSVARDQKVKPDIDHFYPVERYPILAASYFNLIPACHPCNGFNGKSNKDTLALDALSPYLTTNADFKFSYTVNSISIINPLVGQSSVTIKLTGNLGNDEIFNLSKLYEMHDDHVIELIIKQRLKYADRYRKYLGSYQGIYRLNANEVDRLIIGNFSRPADIHKRPLAKLYQDVAKELRLL